MYYISVCREASTATSEDLSEFRVPQTFELLPSAVDDEEPWLMEVSSQFQMDCVYQANLYTNL